MPKATSLLHKNSIFIFSPSFSCPGLYILDKPSLKAVEFPDTIGNFLTRLPISMPLVYVAAMKMAASSLKTALAGLNSPSS